MSSTLTYPGVYIEEVRSGVHPIPGVATSDLNDQKCKNIKVIAILIVALLGVVLAVRTLQRRRQRKDRVRNDA